jgi:hypothetical protein
MPFRPERIINKYKQVTDESLPNAIAAKLLSYSETANYHEKVEIIAKTVEHLIGSKNRHTTKMIMAKCGADCIGNAIIAKAKSIYSKYHDLYDFVDKLNQNHIGGGRLIYSNGIIKGGYNKCYCGSVSKSGKLLPIEYCYCSAGWYKQLFEEILSRNIEVKVLNSIISGSKTCDFEIRIKEKMREL